MTTYQWLCLAGVPSIVGAVVLFFLKYYKAKFEAQRAEIKTTKEQTDAELSALKLGTQAMLRDRLYVSYQYGVNKGYTELWERENFLNMYTQYHSLGANGIMDDIKQRYFELPDKAEHDKGVNKND